MDLFVIWDLVVGDCLDELDQLEIRNLRLGAMNDPDPITPSLPTSTPEPAADPIAVALPPLDVPPAIPPTQLTSAPDDSSLPPLPPVDLPPVSPVVPEITSPSTTVDTTIQPDVAAELPSDDTTAPSNPTSTAIPDDLPASLEEKLGNVPPVTPPPTDQAAAVDLPSGGAGKLGKGIKTAVVAGIVAIFVGIAGGGIFFATQKASNKQTSLDTSSKADESCHFAGNCFEGCGDTVFLHKCPGLTSGACNQSNPERTNCFVSGFCGTQQLDVFPDATKCTGSDKDDKDACDDCKRSGTGAENGSCDNVCAGVNPDCYYSATKSRVDTCDGTPPVVPPPPGNPSCGSPCTKDSDCASLGNNPACTNMNNGNGICWSAAACEDNKPPDACTEEETCPGPGTDGQTKVCGPKEDCIVRNSDGGNVVWGCRKAKECKPPEDNSGVLCAGLDASATAPAVGESVNLTCKSKGSTKVNHFEFRYRIGQGAWVSLGSGTATGVEGKNKQFTGSSQLIVPSAGNYKVQCRVCKKTDGGCTDWGKKS